MAPITDTPHKATLFCPACGHESHAEDGDWVVRATPAGDRRLHCPECDTTITVRPDFDGDSPTERAITAWFAAWESWVSAWTPWRADEGDAEVRSGC